LGVIKQIYHVWEGYLRKIPVLRNEFGGKGKKVKYVFANTTAEGKKVKFFTSEHFWVSNLINHVTLRIKVKKKYSKRIWQFNAREGI
jgi:hypothetical protein